MVREKRRSNRRPADIPVRYAVTEVQKGLASRIELKGKIIDVSENGFGLLTSYPLQKGHVITISRGGGPVPTGYGIVKWVKPEDDHYRVGLGLHYKE